MPYSSLLLLSYLLSETFFHLIIPLHPLSSQDLNPRLHRLPCTTSHLRASTPGVGPDLHRGLSCRGNEAAWAQAHEDRQCSGQPCPYTALFVSTTDHLSPVGKCSCITFQYLPSTMVLSPTLTPLKISSDFYPFLQGNGMLCSKRFTVSGKEDTAGSIW